mmetsp:Transcript_18750/g.51513  ORF Transcript_18750/g.51513 Transcript_18750/m.51513 type:complete len:413 (+) Transcript_18750:116-1354(+)
MSQGESQLGLCSSLVTSRMLPLVFGALLPRFAHGLVSVSSCKWDKGRLHVRWDDAQASSTDYYELQLADSDDGHPTAVYSTAGRSADLDFLLENTSYWVRVRAHVAGAPSLGPSTWLQPSIAVECRTGAGVAHRQSPPPQQNTFLLEVMRESEFTNDVDYLMNHNAASIEADVAFLISQSLNPDRPDFLNVTFRTATLTLYCLELLRVSVPNTITTEGNDQFADYASCNNDAIAGGNASDPKCVCDNAIDRFLGSKDPSALLKQCHNGTSGGACTQYIGGCVCECTDSSLAASAKYVGMTPVYFNQPGRLGYWYSAPSATECKENEQVGTVRVDGTRCTWKRHAEARVLKGGDVLAVGWNRSTSPGVDWRISVDVSRVRQNADVVRKAFRSSPYQPWTCNIARKSTPSDVIV